MKNIRPLLTLFFFSVIGCNILGETITSTNWTAKLKDVEHMPWEPVTNTILRSNGKLPVEVGGKRSVYKYEVGPYGKASVPVVAFISPEHHKVWIGPEQDFYVEIFPLLIRVTPYPSAVKTC